MSLSYLTAHCDSGTRKRVAVGMSGGVDSSVTAALFAQAGFEVVGFTLLLLPESLPGAREKAEAAISDAQRVCAQLGIDHHVVDVHDVFEHKVIEAYAHEYAHARTPNPCVICNEEIKFGLLYDAAMDLGCDLFATGHYAIAQDGHLMMATNPDKDQSYFMYRIPRERLLNTVFPLGKYTKPEVRALAAEFGLVTAQKSESQGACFITDLGRRCIVETYAPQAYKPGEMVDVEGKVVGTHQGIAHYTIGQRKGIGIGGLVDPYYIVDIDASNNRIVVGQRGLSTVSTFVSDDPVFDAQLLDEQAPDWREGNPIECTAAVRYNMTPVAAMMSVHEGTLEVRFDRPLEGVAEGQSVVCYFQSTVVGGGIISCAS